MDPIEGNTPPDDQPKPPGPIGDITRLLRRLAAGDLGAAEPLFRLIYAELKRLAAAKLKRERPGHTLQPTALVNEAYMKMMQHNAAAYDSRSHFMAVAAQAMRRILADHARAHKAKKRDAFSNAIPLEAVAENRIASSSSSPDHHDLDEALHRLAEIKPRAAKVVEMQYFGGLTQDEIAVVLKLSSRTVKRDWEFAQAWLKQELSRES